MPLHNSELGLIKDLTKTDKIEIDDVDANLNIKDLSINKRRRPR